MLSRTINKTVDTRRFILGGLLLAGLDDPHRRGRSSASRSSQGTALFEIQDGNVVDSAPANPAPDWDSLFGTNSPGGPPPGPVSR